jgi:hypothetical protein
MDSTQAARYVLFAGIGIFLFGTMMFLIANLAALVGVDIGDIGYVCQFGPICPMALGSMMTAVAWAMTAMIKPGGDTPKDKKEE